MATLRKTFADGDILTAADVNNGLNPATADHIPYAVQTGVQSCAGSGTASPSTTAVTFAAGRFSAAPIIILSPDTTSLKLVARAINRATGGFSIYLGNSDGTALSGSFNIGWTAIQMTPTSGAG